MSVLKNSLLLVISTVLLPTLWGQSAHKQLRQGDQAYKQEKYDLAEESYRKAIEQKPNAKGSFNLGNTVYQQERYEEAVQHYEESINNIEGDIEKAEALYNLGNAQLRGGQLEDAIESYKSAVRINPEDDDIRQNLYLAKLMKRQEEQQQQQQQQEQQDNQSSEEENSEEQQQQEQQQQGENEQEQPQSGESEIENEGGESPVPEEAQELSKEDAEKLLQVIENEEKNVQEKLRKISGNKKKPKKDW